MKSTPTLSSVQDNFQQWRQQITKPRERVPKDLRQQALALHDNMSSGRIQKALGISRDMLDAWAGKAPATCSQSSTSIDFISLPSPLDAEGIENQSISLSFAQPNGNCWTLQGNFSSSQLNSFINAFSRGEI